MGSTYCDIAPGHEWHGPYHDTEYGFPLTDDAELFERLVLEINQAGLSWLTILKKRDAFRQAYDHFDPAAVARYGTRGRHRQCEPGARAGRCSRLVRRLDRSQSPAQQARMGHALPPDLPVHRRRDL